MARTIMSVFNGQNGRTSGADAPSNAADAESTAAANSGAPGTAHRSVMTLGKTLTFKGELSADEDLVLLGRVEGSITHTESLTVGVGGVVIGDLQARVITIKGTVEGDLEATESIVIAPTATVVGDLVAPRVSIVEGATFNGAVNMARAVVADVPKAAVAPSISPAGQDVLSDKTVDQLLVSNPLRAPT
jgi:cytoskeletal protein CcmA (bactofilin family)